MKIVQHGFGIVEFSEVININQEYLASYINYLEQINPPHFDIVEENGKKFALTKSGFKFNFEDIKDAPVRYNLLYKENKSLHFDFVQNIDKALYGCLVEYCKIFPDAARTIWWKTQGHVAAYGPGQHIGPHSDSHIEFDFKNPALNQAPIHNTVSCGLYLNNSSDQPDNFSYSGGEMYFEQANYTFVPRQGSVIMYPSNYIGRHEVKPVTKGNRYVYLQFYSYGNPEGTPVQWMDTLNKDSLGA